MKKEDRKRIIIIILIVGILGLMMFVFLSVPKEGGALNLGQQPNGGEPNGETPPPTGPPGAWCTDHDGGKVYTVSSWCEDSDGRFLQDYCSGNTLMEAYCNANACTYYSHGCIACVNGVCTDVEETPIECELIQNPTSQSDCDTSNSCPIGKCIYYTAEYGLPNRCHCGAATLNDCETICKGVQTRNYDRWILWTTGDECWAYAIQQCGAYYAASFNHGCCCVECYD